MSEESIGRRGRRIVTLVSTLVLAAAGVLVAAPPVNAGNSPIAVQVSASPNPVASGAQLTYTIVVSNTGGAAMTQVSVVDQVNGMTGIDNTNQLVLSSTAGSCTQSDNTGGKQVSCAIGNLAGFSSATITIRGVVTAANGTVLNNTAVATGTKSATTFTASGSVAVQVQGGGNPTPKPDLTMSVTAPATVPPNQGYYVTLTVNNLGAVNATDITATATLPAAATFVEASTTSLFTCGAPAGSSLTCSGGAVNTGANATIRVLLTAPATNGVALVATAAVDPLNTIPESNELNNAGQATTTTSTTPPAGTLAITKVDSPDPVVKYENITYTIDVTNTTGSRADYMTVTDGTTGLDAASITATASIIAGSTGTGPTCTVNAPTVTCETTRFQPGSIMRVVIVGKVIVPAGSVIINTATVNGNVKNKGITNTATAVTTVRPGVDLTVTQYRTLPAAPAPVRAADRFDYTVTVGNSGLNDATNVRVYEVLPAGVHFDGFSASVVGTTCNAVGSNPVDCTIPVVPGNHATATITLELIAPHATGPISSTVVVDPDNAIAENDDSNNTFLTTTDVQTGIDFTVTKVADHEPVARNGTLRYTITVPNIGTQNATGVLVRDELPAGAVYRASSGDHNFTCGLAGQYVECTGGIIRGTYSGSLLLPVDVATITIDIFAPDVDNVTMRNEVRVDPLGAIPEINEDNNIAEEFTLVSNGSPNGSYRELDIPSITVNHDPVATSGTLDYTLTIRNTGAANADNVVVAIALPATSIFRAANDTAVGTGAFTCAHSSGKVVCSGGTVLAGGTRQILVQVFAPPVPGVALLEAIVDPDNAILESDEYDNRTNKLVNVASIDSGSGAYIELHVTDITDNWDPVAPGGTLEYSIPVENSGAAAAFGVTFRATLPSGSIFRSADDQGGGPDSFSCTQSAGVVTCTGANIPAGATRVVKLSVFAPTTPGLYRLDVAVDPANAIPEAHEADNSAEEFTSVALGGGGGFIDLTVGKTATPQVTPGGLITYTLTVANGGTDDAFNVVVRDALPAGTAFVSATGDGGFVCTNAGGVVDCSGGWVRGTIAGGGNRTITIKVNAPLAHDVTLTNQAFVDPANAIAEASEVNNSASADTLVFSQIDLTISAPTGNVSQGSEGDTNASVTNSGTQDAHGVVAIFNEPIGSIIINVVAPTGWSCQTNENPVNQVICTGSVLAGQTVPFTIRVYQTTSGTASTNAVVDPGNLIVESNETNNTASGAI